MKYAFIADIHARGKDLDSLAKQLDALTASCRERQVERLLIAGDVFDRPGIGDAHASTGAICEVVCGWAARFARDVAPIVAIPGNHDLAGSGSRDALHVLDEISCVTVEHKPSVTSLSWGGDIILSLPWMWSGSATDEINMLMERSKALRLSGKDQRIILLGHIQVIGGKHGAVNCEAKPSAWQVTPEFLNSLPVDKIALGDFHRRQPFYVGALRELNHGESGNPAGWELWDSGTGASEWIELNAAPKYCTIKVESAEQAKNWHIMEGDEVNGEIVRIQYKNFEPDPDMVRELEACGAEVMIISEKQERARRAEIAPGLIDDSHALLDLYAGVQEPPFEAERLARAHAALGCLLEGAE